MDHATKPTEGRKEVTLRGVVQQKHALVLIMRFGATGGTGLGGGIFSRITTLFETAVEAARSSEGIFTSIFLLFLFCVEECPVET